MAASVTAIPKAEEGGNFFTRMAWYYQMGILLLLVLLLLYAADMAFYSETRAQTRKIREETDVLRAENQQGEAIRMNLITAEATLKAVAASDNSPYDDRAKAAEALRAIPGTRSFSSAELTQLANAASGTPQARRSYQFGMYYVK